MKMVPKNIFTVKRTLDTLNKGSKFASVVVRCQSVWSQDNVIRSPYKDVEIPNCTLYDYVWQNLDRWPERTVSVCAITGRGYTYEQAFKLSNTFAANLRIKLKIQDGDVIAVMLPNIPDYPLVNMGILGAGGVITSINPIYTAHEVQRQLLMSNTKVVITLPETVKTIKDALKLAKLDIPIIVVKTNGNPTPDGTFCFNELSEDHHADTSVLKTVRRSGSDICFLPYSSGTTGLPKGVELSHRNIIANGEQVNEEGVRCHNETTATHQDSVLAVLPFFHIYAATVVMFHKMSLGCKVVTLPKLQPEIYFNCIEKHKTNVLFVAPPLVLLMGSHPLANEKTYQYIETLINGAAPLSNTDVERFIDKVKRDIDFRQGYGLTETSPTVTITPRNWAKKDYAVTGPPIPNTELRIVDANLKNLGPNEVTTHQDSVLAVLPFFHIYAATVVMFHKMSLGCKVVTLPKLQPEIYFNCIEKHKTNVLFVAPPLVLLMGSHPLANEKTYQYIETLINGAAPLSNTDVERFIDKVKRDIDFRQGYGLTETSPTVTITPRNWAKKDYAVTGPPIPNTELRIVDANLKNLGPNETGEILIRGPQVMRGYRDNPQANNEAFTVDGWFKTGDLAVADEDGFVTIADRLKELIKVKGFQVPPAELEAVLRQHPAVNDAAVIGVPHPTNGEEPKAFIVLKNNQSCQTKDIVDFVKERVAPYKRVTDVTIIDAIPKSSAGKILRRVLKDNYC